MKFSVLSKFGDSSLNTRIMAKLDERIGFLGGGNMAFAIGYGLINRGTVLFYNSVLRNQSHSYLYVFIFARLKFLCVI